LLSVEIQGTFLRRGKIEASKEAAGLGGGYSQKKWVEVCGLPSKTLTLSVT